MFFDKHSHAWVVMQAALVLVFTIIFAATFNTHANFRPTDNEEPCRSNGGNCIPIEECAQKSSARNTWCPNRAINVICCLPFQEASCHMIGGQCQRTDQACSIGVYRRGLCTSQPENVQCCAPNMTGCTEAECIRETPMPLHYHNQGFSPLQTSSLKAYFGHEPCDITTNVVLSKKLEDRMIIANVGPFQARGLAPFVQALQLAFSALREAKPGLYARLGDGGSFKCRKGVNGDWTNHAFGAALDLKIDGIDDPPANGMSLVGLYEIYPYMAARGLYWAGGSSIREDSVHFEISAEVYEEWLRSGKI